MPDYSKSIIYTIKTGNSLYVGSTTNFTKRKYNHKTYIYINSKMYDCKLYKTIRENGGEWDMKPYKEYPCENKTQLTIEEERIRSELNADLNMVCCYSELSKKERDKKYYENNKEHLDKINKEYAKKYPDKIKLYKAKNREKNKAEKITCECGRVLPKYSLPRHKTSKIHLSFIQSIVN